MATKDYSNRQENMIARFLGWSVVTGSGAAACHPGDIISDEWLGECKTHVEPGHKIYFSKAVWSKIKDEAAVKRRFPVLFTDDGSQKIDNTWCLLNCDQVDLDVYDLCPITKGINVNISFDHIKMLEIYKQHKRGKGKPIALCANWHNESVAIVPLDTFYDMVVD